MHGRRPNRTAQQIAGDDSEALVAHELEVLGWRIIARNLRLGRKEVDVLAFDPGPPRRLVIVEVRGRRSRAFGGAEETFDWRKRAHLRAAAGQLAQLTTLANGVPLPRAPIAIDLFVVEPGGRSGPQRVIRHYRDALG